MDQQSREKLLNVDIDRRTGPLQMGGYFFEAYGPPMPLLRRLLMRLTLVFLAALPESVRIPNVGRSSAYRRLQW